MGTTETWTGEVDDRLGLLERRMARLEARVRAGEPTSRTTPAPRPAAPATVSAAPDRPVAVPTVAPSPPVAPPTPADTTAEAPRRDLERLFGGRVLAWVGGVAVVAGLCLLFALAISHGWIGPLERCVLGGLLSSVLVAFGLRFGERGGRTDAAQAAVACGGAGLFLTVTAAARVYDLLPPTAGLLLAGAVASGLALVAVRWSSQGVAALGLAGALAAPLLADAPAGPWTLAFLLVAVLAATIVVLREGWPWLSLLVFALPAGQWVAWLAGDGAHRPVAALAVLLAFGAVNAAGAIATQYMAAGDRLRLPAAYVLALNALVLATAGWFALDAAAGHSAALAWLAFLTLAHLGAGVLSGRARRLGGDLRMFLLTLAVLLADVTVALLDVDAPARAVIWAASAVAIAAVARRGAAGRTRAATLGAGLGGQLALVTAETVTQLGGVSPFSGDVAGTAVAGLLALSAACLISGRLVEAGHPRWREALDIAGLVAVAALGALTLDGLTLTLAWAALALGLARIGARQDDELARAGALGFLLLSAGWCLADQASPAGLLQGDTALLPAAAGLAAVSGVAALIARMPCTAPAVRRVLGAMACAGPLYLASLAVVAWSPPATYVEGLVVGQRGQLQLSGLWALTGVAALIAGLRLDRRPLRIGALVLLGATAGKVFLFDLAVLSSVYRVASLLALGLLLLAGAFAYQRLRPGTLRA